MRTGDCGGPLFGLDSAEKYAWRRGEKHIFSRSVLPVERKCTKVTYAYGRSRKQAMGGDNDSNARLVSVDIFASSLVIYP